MPRRQWHPAVHETWGHERLYFWRLAFSPTYDRGRITAALLQAIESHGVEAFTIYELFGGGYDILLRVWLPVTHSDFQATLEHLLRDYAVVMQSFAVTKTVAHWPWTDPSTGGLRQVSKARLRERLPNADILRLNSGRLQDAELERYQRENLIAPAPHGRGIKFAVVISAHHHPMTPYTIDRLESRLQEVLTDATHVTEKSLYAGIGFGQYLIMGRVKDYFAITREITEPINTAVDPATFGARTTTFLVSTPSALASRDELRTTEDGPGSRTLADYLHAEESQTLEVKGSAFFDIDRWAFGKGTGDDKRVTDGLLRAITGMLNADGGTVVVGALERKRYRPTDNLAGYSTFGHYVCIGIEFDLGDRDWDHYERRLRQTLESRVKPDPNPWLVLTPTPFEGTVMCVITITTPVRDSDLGARWFYHEPDNDKRPRFWVRRGNRTIELSGPALDDYRFEKARGTGRSSS